MPPERDGISGPSRTSHRVSFPAFVARLMGKIVLYAPMISHSGDLFHPIRIERRKGKGTQDRVLKFDAKKLLLPLTPLNSTQDGLSSVFCQSVGSRNWVLARRAEKGMALDFCRVTDLPAEGGI